MNHDHLATALDHEAQAIRNKDARVKGPKLLSAVSKWLRGGKLPSDVNETIEYMESQYEWASANHRPATAGLYRAAIQLLWPERKK